MEHLKNILHIEIINEQKTILLGNKEVLQMDNIAYGHSSLGHSGSGVLFSLVCLFEGLKYLVSSEDTPISDNDNLA